MMLFKFYPKEAINCWHIAWPMIVANISIPLLGLVDTAVLGYLPNATYLGGVAIGASILTSIYWGFGFLRMGTTGLTAQALGKKDEQELVQLLGKSVVLALFLSICLVILQKPLFELTLYLMSASEKVRTQADIYLSIRIYSAPAALINYVALGWLLGNQNSKASLWVLVVSNSINITFDLILVPGLGMKADGAALATVIAEYCGLAVAIYLMKQQILKFSRRISITGLKKISTYRVLLRVNRYIFIRSISLLLTINFFHSQGARQGDSLLAANAVLLNLLHVVAYGLDGFAHAAEALVGKAVGNKNIRQLHINVITTGQLSLIIAIATSFLFVALGDNMIRSLTSIQSVQHTAILYLPWLIALPLISIWCYWMDGVFIGATQARWMQNTMLFSAFCIFLPCWYFTQSMENHGLWLSFCIFNASRGISLILAYYFLTKNSRWFIRYNY